MDRHLSCMKFSAIMMNLPWRFINIWYYWVLFCFNFTHSVGYIVVSHFGICIFLKTNDIENLSLCALVIFRYLLLGGAYIIHLPICDWASLICVTSMSGYGGTRPWCFALYYLRSWHCCYSCYCCLISHCLYSSLLFNSFPSCCDFPCSLGPVASMAICWATDFLVFRRTPIQDLRAQVRGPPCQIPSVRLFFGVLPVASVILLLISYFFIHRFHWFTLLHIANK